MKVLEKPRVFSAFMLVVAILTTLLLSACGDNTTTPVPEATLATNTPAATTNIPTTGGFLETIKQRGKLIVGVKYDQPGFGLNDPISKRLEGFEVDMAREFARGLLGSADKVEFVGVSFG